MANHRVELLAPAATAQRRPCAEVRGAQRATKHHRRRAYPARVGVGLLAMLASVLAPAEALADPQGNVSIISGLCGEGTRDELWQSSCWYNALHGDYLLGRDRNSDVGLGPYLEVATAGFDDLRLGGGGSVHLPISEYVPAVLSLGGYARLGDDQWTPGLAADLFIGSRSYNFHSAYVMTGGLSLGTRYGLGDSRELTFIIAAQLDSSVLWLPGVLLYNWIKGSPDR